MRLWRYYFLHKFLLMMTLGRQKCTTISNFAIINIIITTIFCDFIVTILPFIIIITKITNTAILISHHTCQKILSCSKYDGNMSQNMIDLDKQYLEHIFWNILPVLYLKNGFNLNLLLVLLRVSQKGWKSLTYPI